MFIIIATTIGLSNAANVNSIVSWTGIIYKLGTEIIQSYNESICIILATPLSTPGCEYQFGIYPDSGECSTSYLKCAEGIPHQQSCDAGLAYDERIHGCNWPDQLLHICNPEGGNRNFN